MAAMTSNGTGDALSRLMNVDDSPVRVDQSAVATLARSEIEAN